MAIAHKHSRRLVGTALSGLLALHAVRAHATERSGTRPAQTVHVRTPPAIGRADSEPAVAVYLHGLCGGPVHGCRTLRPELPASERLVCPEAPSNCPSGGMSWQGPRAAQRRVVDDAVERASRGTPGAEPRTNPPIILIGFSQGAYVARALLSSYVGRIRAVAFIGAYVDVDREHLTRLGIRRVLFAAARGDQTYRSMRASADRLRRAGFEARFLDLGAAGHTYVPGPGSPGWQESLTWLARGGA